ncbi:MAG: isocitrate lyase/phosphoenolpyruvate mutase family protein [Phycisphaerales bacterium]|nr:MAG: isocitrate lyase/phosphoenolpyruvate mutase family protein [Phycisphaerales bacterium]
MTKEQQRERAEEFLALHTAPEILVLPNAWDVVSAKIYEVEGFKAIGTTSAGISATLGFPDGEHMSLADNATVVRRMVEHVGIPVSADMEAGYAESPEGVADSTRALLDAGAVGMNLEDGTGDPAEPLFDESLQVEKIKAVREAASARGIHPVLNARTDVYLVPGDGDAARLECALRRAAAYRGAGADCIFVPDFADLDKETITTLVKEIDAPLNIIAGERTPPISELEQIGVARVSFGPRAMRAALALLRVIAREWRDAGTYSHMLKDTVSYAEINRMLERCECSN